MYNNFWGEILHMFEKLIMKIHSTSTNTLKISSLFGVLVSVIIFQLTVFQGARYNQIYLNAHENAIEFSIELLKKNGFTAILWIFLLLCAFITLVAFFIILIGVFVLEIKEIKESHGKHYKFGALLTLILIFIIGGSMFWGYTAIQLFMKLIFGFLMVLVFFIGILVGQSDNK